MESIANVGNIRISHYRVWNGEVYKGSSGDMSGICGRKQDINLQEVRVDGVEDEIRCENDTESEKCRLHSRSSFRDRPHLVGEHILRSADRNHDDPKDRCKPNGDQKEISRRSGRGAVEESSVSPGILVSDTNWGAVVCACAVDMRNEKIASNI